MTATRERVALIIPARDEAETIAAVIEEVRPFVDEVVVVDNGSRDGTAVVAAAAGARVVAEPVPGYGRACMTGARASDAPILVFMDGDGSDIPAGIPALLAALAAGADLALGMRGGEDVDAGSITLPARFGNTLAGVLLAALYGHRLHDLSPLKAIRRDLLMRIAPCELTYGWTVEVLGGALALHSTVVEVEVGYRRRAGGASKVSGNLSGSVRAGVRILGTIGRMAMQRNSGYWIGGALGCGVGALLLIAAGLWLAGAPRTGVRAAAAVWLLAWPLLVTGALAGVGVAAALRRLRHTDPTRDTSVRARASRM